ncbi:MAG: hypothetical protein JST17_05950 [Bacteroidetes bacterium]|nr:hypothetical protein [Bacteroidota bacterium]MBS1929899.1 hypothetical protein [Bacteroidota bacterium]
MKEGIQFYACQFGPVDWDNLQDANKWIESKEEAVNSRLHFDNTLLNKRDPDVLYQTMAQYIFVVGGGDRWVTADKCSAEFNGNTIIIKYVPLMNTNKVGETEPSLICMELNKIMYPDYKKMKIVFKAM